MGTAEARYIFLPRIDEKTAEDRSVSQHLIPRKNQCAVGTDVTRLETSIAGDEPADLERVEEMEAKHDNLRLECTCLGRCSSGRSRYSTRNP